LRILQQSDSRKLFKLLFYHLIENALKYSKPNSKINIDFEDRPTEFLINFKMTSTFVKPSERELIFNEGFRVKLQKNK
jgi:K+-sensing histidine kinase KdpD